MERSVKPKDPNSTARAKVILDSEGKQTVQARSSKINADKKTGTGVLKVRYQKEISNHRIFDNQIFISTRHFPLAQLNTSLCTLLEESHMG